MPEPNSAVILFPSRLMITGGVYSRTEAVHHDSSKNLIGGSHPKKGPNTPILR